MAIDAVGCDATGSAVQDIFGGRLKMMSGNSVAFHWAVNSVRKGGSSSGARLYGGPYAPMITTAARRCRARSP